MAVDNGAAVKHRNDERKIKDMADSGHPHQYDRVEFRPWTGNGYIKSWYELQKEDGTIIPFVWPNAGIFQHQGVRYDASSNVKIRLAVQWPY